MCLPCGYCGFIIFFGHKEGSLKPAYQRAGLHTKEHKNAYRKAGRKTYAIGGILCNPIFSRKAEKTQIAIFLRDFVS